MEIRDLLQIIAEPALEKRDVRLRSLLRTTAGSSKKKAGAILLMNGGRSRAEIVTESGIDKSDLSKLLKTLSTHKLIGPDDKKPKLALTIPPTFFEGEDQ